MVEALNGVPAFAASFSLLAMIWWAHASWSRSYGLDDGRSVLLSLLLVFLVLVYVYPLRIIFSMFFNWISVGWLPSNVTIGSDDDLQVLLDRKSVGSGKSVSVRVAPGGRRPIKKK